MEEQNKSTETPSATEDAKINQEAIDFENDLKLKKFIAYMVSIFIALGGCIAIYLTTKDTVIVEKYLNFLLYALTAYIGGNSIEKFTNKKK